MTKILIVSPIKQDLAKLELDIKTFCNAVTICCRSCVYDGILELDKQDYDALIVPDIDSEEFSGFLLAKKAKLVQPKIKVIFVAKATEGAVKAFKTRANGYLVNPTVEELDEEFSELGIGSIQRKRAVARTFGNFDLFADGKPVKFSKSKSKELLAFLIYKRGTAATSSELIVNLWEDRDVDRTTRSMLHNYLSDIKKTLDEYGISDIFSYERNQYRIVKENLACDYFSFLNGNKKVINSYLGEFMSEYEWADYTAAELSNMKDNMFI